MILDVLEDKLKHARLYVQYLLERHVLKRTKVEVQSIFECMPLCILSMYARTHNNDKLIAEMKRAGRIRLPAKLITHRGLCSNSSSLEANALHCLSR